ncbi:MAG: dipeptide epimerase [Cyclobacteriaceae bacterium]|nr:dipeptide epimerase [Cyclobacteriaceae bacterium]
MELQVYEFELALRYPFSISRHTYDSIRTMIVELTYENISGFGEATVNPYYGITIDNLVEAFSTAAEFLEDFPFVSPRDLWQNLHLPLTGNFFALSAIDCAAHDLYGKLKGASFSHMHGINYSKYPFTSYTLGISDTETIKKKIRKVPWPVYKLKLGAPNDLEIIREIRKHTGSLIRIDANGGWSLEHAVKMVEVLSEIGVEFVEQPLNKDQWQDMDILHKKFPLPMIADESCVREEDVEKCHGNFDGINVKLSKCGGLTPALRMVERARDLGMKVMIGCMTESTVGISAAAQLLPLVDYADLDGPLLLKEDVATGIKYKNGCLKLKSRNGLGFNFKYGKFESKLVKL